MLNNEDQLNPVNFIFLNRIYLNSLRTQILMILMIE